MILDAKQTLSAQLSARESSKQIVYEKAAWNSKYSESLYTIPVLYAHLLAQRSLCNQ